ncbi:pentapeptide repeat-containing protein [Streptomyces sp. NPDC047976]|uniref:pentapeptide repeat-containing protein n=1 Tax=Streptomyces sp. NPDC047976 TaxID=3155746 RepID=UPI00343A2AC3
MDMTAAPYHPRTAPDVPSWPHCADALPDGAGCRGRRVEPYAVCLAHLPDAERAAHLAGLRPGAGLDHRGTHFTEALLAELLTALTEPSTPGPAIGRARFEEAVFHGAVRFDLVRIDGDAVFDGAEIAGDVSFDRAGIGGRALFRQVRIGGDACFGRMTVRRRAVFEGTEAGGSASFERMRVDGRAVFDGLRTGRDASFKGMEVGGFLSLDQARIGGDGHFDRARISGVTTLRGLTAGGRVSFPGAAFEGAARLGPLVCAGTLDLSEAVFGSAMTLEAAAAAVRCRRTRWTSTAALRLRYAAVDLGDAVVESPLSITARARPFAVDGGEPDGGGLLAGTSAGTLAETALLSDGAGRRPDAGVRIMSLRGVDAAHLVLTGVDLTDCLFAGTVHLDQLRLEGKYTFAAAPAGLRRRGIRPARWTPRRTLAEEHHWRASRGRAADGWTPAPAGEEVQEPTALAPVYRQLRKAFEDGRHEPGAADFYYGEMEMRRHADDIPRAERSLLTAYWALSGYGQRASRALGWLLAAMTVTVLAMMLWGLPQNDPKPRTTGTVAGRSITMTTDVPGPVNPDGPYRARLTADRFEKSLRVVVNSVVFRSSGQNLTTAGTYTEMASRLTEPALLGLAVLAVRSRLKR